jgi:hypothetical protein
MLVVMADAYDDALDLSVRRDRFTCADFSYDIALNGMSGSVVLLPEGRTLIVSDASVGYVQIRVIDSEGTPLGSMTLNAEGHVIWSTPDLS